MYDIIGDIHGHATPLKKLLSKMDYSEIDGVWQHPERKAIFLGDFIDRGPEQLEVIRIAKTMVEAGYAQAVMGNHEFNAVAWATTAEDGLGFLRAHSEKNKHQHKSFLTQIGEGSLKHREVVEWFKTLPLFLDIEGLRVVHACWHKESLQILESFTDEHNCILSTAWAELNQKGCKAYDALEVVLKGLEIKLPTGVEFSDKDGHSRTHIRTRWWELDALTYRDLAMVPSDVIELIPHTPIPADLLPGYAGDKLLFVGHYWMSGEPTALSPHIACLDYSIAASAPTNRPDERRLCAYRWKGESEIHQDNFINVKHS
jgi:hypothetical protein